MSEQEVKVPEGWGMPPKGTLDWLLRQPQIDPEYTYTANLIVRRWAKEKLDLLYKAEQPLRIAEDVVIVRVPVLSKVEFYDNMWHIKEDGGLATYSVADPYLMETFRSLLREGWGYIVDILAGKDKKSLVFYIDTTVNM